MPVFWLMFPFLFLWPNNRSSVAAVDFRRFCKHQWRLQSRWENVSPLVCSRESGLSRCAAEFFLFEFPVTWSEPSSCDTLKSRSGQAPRNVAYTQKGKRIKQISCAGRKQQWRDWIRQQQRVRARRRVLHGSADARMEGQENWAKWTLRGKEPINTGASFSVTAWDERTSGWIEGEVRDWSVKEV